ncbi:UNVERIFIED_CONTAM: hypothetical protein FKN15_066026 [Acipenser sinensis]
MSGCIKNGPCYDGRDDGGTGVEDRSGDGEDDDHVPGTSEKNNDTKYRVDVLDQMARQYSVKASSRRWPVVVFYNVLDLAAFILYKECTRGNISRRDFILKLATELRQKHFDQKTAKQQAAAAQPGFSAAQVTHCGKVVNSVQVQK